MKVLADYACIGPHNAEDFGLTVIEANGKLYGIKNGAG